MTGMIFHERVYIIFSVWTVQHCYLVLPNCQIFHSPSSIDKVSSIASSSVRDFGMMKQRVHLQTLSDEQVEYAPTFTVFSVDNHNEITMSGKTAVGRINSPVEILGVSSDLCFSDKKKMDRVLKKMPSFSVLTDCDLMPRHSLQQRFFNVYAKSFCKLYVSTKAEFS